MAKHKGISFSVALIVVLFVCITIAIIFRYMVKQKVEAAATNKNVKAFLDMIALSEGTENAGGYNALYSSLPNKPVTFSDFSKHPNRRITAWGITSTAAGRYQILYGTYLEAAAILGITDFSPESQDKIAIFLLQRRGVLELIVSGEFEKAIKGNGKRGNGARWEWASLPDSPYGQRTHSLAQVQDYYLNAGGTIA